MPDVPTLNAYMYDYLNVPPYGGRLAITEGNRLSALAVLREYLVMCSWLGPGAMPGHAPAGAQGSSRDRNPDGSLVRPIDFSAFDNWIATVRPCSRYCLYIEADYGRKKPATRIYDGGFAPGTKEHETAVSTYITALAEHIEALGLDKSRFVLCPADEPWGHEKDPLTAQFIRIAPPG